MPQISIIMPVFNEQGNTEKTILSIISQSYKDFELIIINDGSTDETFIELQNIKDNRIQIYTTENQGISKALNFAINHSRGPFIARIDAGDIAFPRWLESQLNYLTINNLDVCFPRVIIANTERMPISIWPLLHKSPLKTTKHITKGGTFSHPFTIMKTKSLLLVGCYSIADGIEDIVLWNKFAKQKHTMGVSTIPVGLIIRDIKHNDKIKERLAALFKYKGIQNNKYLFELSLLRILSERHIIYRFKLNKHHSDLLKHLRRKYWIRYSMILALTYTSKIANYLQLLRLHGRLKCSHLP